MGTILPSKIIELRKLENQNSYPLGKVTWKENSSHQSSNWSLNQVRSNRSLVFNWCVQLHNIFLVITAVLWWWGGQIYVTICTTLTRWHKSFLIGMAYSQPYTRSLVYKQPKEIMTNLCCLKFGRNLLVWLLICCLIFWELNALEAQNFSFSLENQ